MKVEREPLFSQVKTLQEVIVIGDDDFLSFFFFFLEQDVGGTFIDLLHGADKFCFVLKKLETRERTITAQFRFFQPRFVFFVKGIGDTRADESFCVLG